MLGVPGCMEGIYQAIFRLIYLDLIFRSKCDTCCVDAECCLSAPPTFQQMLLLSHAHIMTPHWACLLSTKGKTKEHHWSCSHASLCHRRLQISGAENCIITFHKSSQKKKESLLQLLADSAPSTWPNWFHLLVTLMSFSSYIILLKLLRC